jgi:GNAT superfamily N-acetyltransferase
VSVLEVEIREEAISALPEHGSVPTAFEVDRVLDLEARENGLGGFALHERVMDTPWRKDYDAIDGEGPAAWAREFDVTNWGLLVARADGRRVGGVVIAFASEGVHMLEGRRDLAVIWDIRVAPDARAKGVGTRLFQAAESWARARGCTWLKVETQNINVAACRFYQRRGCVLGAIHRFAYPDLPAEVMLLWYKDLAATAPGR